MPDLPLAFRAVNRGGRLLRRLGVPAGRLDAARLLAGAQRQSGLHALGGGVVREGLERLVAALEHEAALTPMGRIIAHRELGQVLANRLRLVQAWMRHPEIEAQPVARPIFILGLPRTGTSILHELLAQDPANRVPRTWEVMWPWPPPERARVDDDPRIRRAERHFARIDRALPAFKTMHPMGARLPQECVALMAHDCASMMHHVTHDVPSYQRWLEGLDHRPVYVSHRRQLQYLQWRCPGERWVLKSPGHLWTLDALLAVYPDARIVQTHRDPVRVAASLVSLIAYLRSLASDRIDPQAIAADWVPRLARGLAHTIAVRDRTGLAPERVFDVPFDAFMADEIGTVRRLYDHFGLRLTPEVAERMRACLAAHPKGRHGAHRYALAGAGLDEHRERERFRGYQERFAVPSEPVT